MDVNPGLDSSFFVLPHSRSWYYTNFDTTYDPGNIYTDYVRQMNKDVIDGLDSLIDYSYWDSDTDGIVDYIAIDYDSVYIPRPYWVGYGRMYLPDSPAYYATQDTNAVGDTVCINVMGGHVQRVHNILRPYFDISAGIWTHEMCHNIPILNSVIHWWSYRFPNAYSYHIGPFQAFEYPPGSWNRIQTYFSPYMAYHVGWLTDDDMIILDSPVYQDTLGDYIETGDLFKVYAESNEYFLISNRQGLNYSDSIWPSHGLFVHHIEGDANSQLDGYHKREDIEIMDGLFVIDDDTTQMIAAPDSGLDEIDYMHVFYSDPELKELTGANFGDSGDVFVPVDTIVFDHTTNPNSNLYSYSNGKWYQNVPSHFSIRNLISDSTDVSCRPCWHDSLLIMFRN